MPDLEREVRRQIVDRLSGRALALASRGSRWEDQQVDLRDDDVIIRVFRERGFTDASFFDVHSPDVQHSLSRVTYWLGDADSLPPSPHGPAEILAGVYRVLTLHRSELPALLRAHAGIDAARSRSGNRHS